MAPLVFNSGPERRSLGTDMEDPHRLAASAPLHSRGAPRLGWGGRPHGHSLETDHSRTHKHASCKRTLLHLYRLLDQLKAFPE